MATIHSEDFAAGNSLFTAAYQYDRDADGVDPLYPGMYQAEGVYINGEGRLDFNPAYTGPFQGYESSGVWLRGIGSVTTTIDDGFWDADQGCMQAVYYPTEESLEDAYAPMIGIPSHTGQPLLSVDVDMVESTLTILQLNDGSHPDSVDVTGAPMPVAGEPYTVRVEWQCGTFEPVEEVAAADGYVRVWINGELVYEATNIALLLRYPITYLTTPPNMVDGIQLGFFGLLGPLDNFYVTDSPCGEAAPIVFKSGLTSSPLVWMKLLLKGAP